MGSQSERKEARRNPTKSAYILFTHTQSDLKHQLQFQNDARDSTELSSIVLR